MKRPTPILCQILLGQDASLVLAQFGSQRIFWDAVEATYENIGLKRAPKREFWDIWLTRPTTCCMCGDTINRAEVMWSKPVNDKGGCMAACPACAPEPKPEHLPMSASAIAEAMRPIPDCPGRPNMVDFRGGVADYLRWLDPQTASLLDKKTADEELNPIPYDPDA